MNNWFECRVKYETIDEQSGKQKKLSIPYMIDAMSYTEAESRIYTEMEQMVSGEFTIPSIKKSNLTDIFFYDTGDVWWKCQVKFISIDEESGKEKKISNNMLVIASDLREAYDRVEESLDGMTVDYTISKITDSTIGDVFPIFKEEE